MAKLSTEARKKLKPSQFALSGGRFPINDKAHAIAAERLVGRAEHAGTITAAEADTVKRKAQQKLHAGQHGYHRISMKD